MQLGNPSGATADTNNHDHYLVQRDVEALDFSDNLGGPVWASWDLTAGDVGSATRSDNYFTDTTLPPNFYRMTDNDYNGVGTNNFNRGHLCPSEDRTDTDPHNDAVFYMSNITPQSAHNNQGVWATFENYCRDLTTANELLIICGPSGFGTNKIPSGKAYIGSNVWKIVVVVPLGGGTALSRITTTTNRVISMIIPNVTNGLSGNWSNYVTSARQIELETGFTFFTALPGTIASAFRAKIDNLVSPPPPGITSFAPTSGNVNTNVVITGTNFNGTSVVKFNGLNAVFIVDSNTQITATVPTNATTGTISVTTPGGTTNSASNFIIGSGGTPDLTLTATHSGNFTQQDVGDTYTIIVTNSGIASTSGTITVSNVLGSGLTATAISGTGWSTTLGTLTATRSDALSANSAYPAITVTVNVASNAPASVTNTVTVSGGDETNAANNTATDIITINAFTNGGDFTGTLVGWDVNGLTGGSGNYGASPLAPTTGAANLTVVGLTRGTGVAQVGTAAVRAWGGTSFTNLTSANAIGSNQFVTCSIAGQTGYYVSYSSISKFDYRHSATGATNALVQYQVGSGAFTDIAAIFYPSNTSAGGSIAPIDLSGITPLQNVGAGTNITFRIVNWGGTSSAGTWYIFDVANNTNYDFAIDGTVSAVQAYTNPVYKILSFSVSNQTATFKWESLATRTYNIECSTDFTNWTIFKSNLLAAGTSYTFTTNVPFGSNFFRIYRHP